MVQDTPQGEDGRERLRANSYPGRGIILGLDESGRYALQVYWITARSAGSRNRILAIDGEDVHTQPFDPAERSNDPNIWYRAIARSGDRHVVSNGVHTDLIADYLGQGRSFADAIMTLDAETDAPNFTPRIAGLSDLTQGRLATSFGMAHRARPQQVSHQIFTYHPKAATGRCFHTYAEDGSPLPPFTGSPYELALPGTPEEVANAIWGLLPADKRVALALKVIDLESRRVATLKVTNALG